MMLKLKWTKISVQSELFPLDMGPHEGHKIKLYFSGEKIMFFSSKYDSVMNYFHNRKESD